jgi:hypothetical protein
MEALGDTDPVTSISVLGACISGYVVLASPDLLGRARLLIAVCQTLMADPLEEVFHGTA